MQPNEQQKIMYLFTVQDIKCPAGKQFFPWKRVRMKKNRILLVNGAPRRGGSTDAAEMSLAEGIINAGGSVDIVRLSGLSMKYPGCSGCMHCQKNVPSPCVFEDDLSALIEKVPGYDVLLFVTPCYFHGATAKMRCFLERLYCLYNIRGGTNQMSDHGQRWALACNAGDPPDGGLLVTDEAFREEAEYAHVLYRSWLVDSTSERGHKIRKGTGLYADGVTFGETLVSW